MTDRLKKRFVVDLSDSDKRRKIMEDLRDSPKNLFDVHDISDSFERSSNSNFNQRINKHWF